MICCGLLYFLWSVLQHCCLFLTNHCLPLHLSICTHNEKQSHCFSSGNAVALEASSSLLDLRFTEFLGLFNEIFQCCINETILYTMQVKKHQCLPSLKLNFCCRGDNPLQFNLFKKTFGCRWTHYLYLFIFLWC